MPSMIWGVWGVCFLVFIVFRLYVYRMSRNEEAQVVLHDSSARLVEEQSAIAAKLQSAKPVGRAILAILGLATVAVVVYYVIDMIHQLA